MCRYIKYFIIITILTKPNATLLLFDNIPRAKLTRKLQSEHKLVSFGERWRVQYDHLRMTLQVDIRILKSTCRDGTNKRSIHLGNI